MDIAQEALLKIEAHEKECSIRYEAIQRQLDQADSRFDRLERLMLQGFGMMASLLAIAVAIVEFSR